eukprot:CAMPEP_0201552702 /NCGR_PEP_ID=MMETSP0173_2-20130828/16921_1 /ASSEMBLY_ACC=CAM_ASM_000268 /TAXON_ID=218659 /ORGANISM="Vexillifera sp., Strain DIVA3 564/2" /LENGTH=244 /DNA_ID=CAMNT_0047963221 /DNA_START=57 /DNA_END=791 /DNA_ORIENTATION=+
MIQAGVVELGEDNYKSSVKDGVWFVAYHAPWCGHCKRLMPTFEELGESAQGYNVGRVDCTENRSVCSDEGVRGYPTLKLIVNGEATKYSGQRTLSALQEFVKEHLPSSGGAYDNIEDDDADASVRSAPAGDVPAEGEVVHLTSDTYKQFTDSGLWLVAYTAPWCGHCKRLAPTWDDLASAATGKGYRIGKVDCTVEKDIASEVGVRGFPTIKLIEDGKIVDTYKGERSVQAFQNYLNEYLVKTK